jgi:hypothetical protein
MECENSAPCVLKLPLPEAMYPGYAGREICILYLIRDHPSVVQIRDARVPDHRHVAHNSSWTYAMREL